MTAHVTGAFTGMHLTAIRHKMRNTQEQLADLLGVSLIGLKRFESGARPVPPYIERSAKAFELCFEKGLLPHLVLRLCPTVEVGAAAIDSSAVAPRYKNKSMQKVYETLLNLARDKGSELYKTDGTPRGGSNVRLAFWDGVQGVPRNGVPPGKQYPKDTMLSAAFQAGKTFAKSNTTQAK